MFIMMIACTACGLPADLLRSNWVAGKFNSLVVLVAPHSPPMKERGSDA
jgi:hypothetical protein